MPPSATLDINPPSLSLLLREARLLVDWKRFLGGAEVEATPSIGRGRRVLVLPGFLATDLSTRKLRLALRQAGFRVHGWKQGPNLGIKADILDRVQARVDQISRRADEPVILIGWSLGGLIAREYAKFAPERVAKVVTLGAPFSGDPRGNNVWRLYEMIARHKVDAPPLDCALAEKPPVDTVAIWSRQDGIVAPACACGQAGESDRRVEIGCGHVEMMSAPEAIRAVLRALVD